MERRLENEAEKMEMNTMKKTIEAIDMKHDDVFINMVPLLGKRQARRPTVATLSNWSHGGSIVRLLGG